MRAAGEGAVGGRGGGGGGMRLGHRGDADADAESDAIHARSLVSGARRSRRAKPALGLGGGARGDDQAVIRRGWFQPLTRGWNRHISMRAFLSIFTILDNQRVLKY